MRTLIFLTFLLTACSGGDSSDSGADTDSSGERSTLEDVGVACIDGNDDDDNHSTARVTVVLSECLESCAMDPQATCEATTDGDTVTVTASGSYSFVPDGEDCASMCIPMAAECQAESVEKGNYILEYAGSSVDFTGPVSAQSCTAP